MWQTVVEMKTAAGSMVDVGFRVRIKGHDAWSAAIEIQRVGKKDRGECPSTQGISLPQQSEFMLDIEGVITHVRPVFISFSAFIGNNGVNF